MSQKITASVGDEASNKPLDVAIVQGLLGTILAEAGGSQDLVTDGIYGDATLTAIKRFQKTQFGFEDRVVRPGEFTFQRMNDMFDYRWKESNPEFPLYIKHSALVSSGLMVDEGFIGQPPHIPSDDGEGWILHLAGVEGKIYYHPVTGAFWVRHLIWAAYVSTGEEKGSLGYPISDERDWVAGGGRVNYFQFGRITHTDAGGAVVEMAPGM